MSLSHGPASSDPSLSSSASSPTTQSTAAAAAADATSSVVFTLMSSALIGDRILYDHSPMPRDLLLLISEYAPFDSEWRLSAVVEMLQPLRVEETELAEKEVNCVKEIKRVQSDIDDIAKTLPAESSVGKLLRSAVVVKGSTLELGGSEYTIDFPSMEVSVRGAKNGDSAPNQQPQQVRVCTEPSRLKIFSTVYALGDGDGDSYHCWEVRDKDHNMLFKVDSCALEIVQESEGLRAWLEARGVHSERIDLAYQQTWSDSPSFDVFVRKFALLLIKPTLFSCPHERCVRCRSWWLEEELIEPRRIW